MSRAYDHHWRKGYEKPGVPMEIPSAAAAFWAKERAKKKKGKKPASVAPKPRPTVMPVPFVSPVIVAGRAIEASRAVLRAVVENVGRIEEMVAPILDREGYGGGQFVPGSLTTKLMLAGLDMDARLVTRLIAARMELGKAESRERQCRADYARAKADEDAKPKPPWL